MNRISSALAVVTVFVTLGCDAPPEADEETSIPSSSIQPLPGGAGGAPAASTGPGAAGNPEPAGSMGSGGGGGTAGGPGAPSGTPGSISLPGSAAPPPAPMPQPLGANCSAHSQCASGLCVSQVCRQRCDLDKPNGCSVGICVPTTLPEVQFCDGNLLSGRDEDNAVLQVGDGVTRMLTPLDDVDLFRVRLNRLGTIVMAATPAPGVNLALDVYDPLGRKVGIFDESGPGEPEAAETVAMTVAGYAWVAVRNVGTTTGAYKFAVAVK